MQPKIGCFSFYYYVILYSSDNMKKINFYNLFYIFIISSIAGWFIEGTWTLLKKGVLINHSALVIGPFNVIYGICAVIASIFLSKYKDESYIKLFILSFIGGSLLEYFMSWGMELVLGFSAWDYSQKFLNINGRIALLYSFFWGILGMLWIKILNPKLNALIEKMNKKVGKIIMICLLVFLLFDVILTMQAITRARACDDGIPPQNSYEKFLDKTFNSKFLKNMFNNQWEIKK